MSNPTPQVLKDEQTPSANGWFQIAVPSNGKHAMVKKIVRHSGDGKPVTTKDILNKLKQLKVIHGIDHEAIDDLINKVNENQAPEEPVIIAVSDVKDGESGSVEWLINGIEKNESTYLVCPGTKVAIRKPATQGKKGKNVFGKLSNPRPGFDIQVKAGNGIRYVEEEDNIVYETTLTGLLSYKDYELSVDNGLKVSDDKLAAHMDVYHGKPVNSDKEISAEDILQNLKESNIVYGIDESAIISALEQARSTDNVVKQVLVAKGKEPVAGEDDQIDWHIDIESEESHQRAVLPNQLIATHSSSADANAGMDIYGEPVPGQDGKKLKLVCGDGVVETEDSGSVEIRAKIMGVACFEEDTISVESRVSISDDNMKVTMDLLRPAIDSREGDISLSHIVSTLNEQGIVYGIKNDAINLVLNNLNKQKASKLALLVAEGTAVKHGKNTRVEYEEQFSENGMLLPDGTIDYQEKSYPWNVKRGDVIGKVVPAVRAEDGKNVMGEIVHAEAAKETLPVLDGVIQEKDGTLKVEREGVLLVNDIKFTVSDTLDVEGDVCQKTGNVHSDKTVNVKGYVEPGLVLETKGDAIIQNNVENATVEADGNVVIKSGIRGTNSRIRAGGNVSALFAENAELNAKGDVLIKNSMMNCHTVCQGKVYVGDKNSRKSALVGDVTQAFGGIEVAILGSDSFSKTIIEAGAGPESLKQLNQLNESLGEIKKGISDLSKLHSHYCKNPKPQEEQNAILLKLNGTLETKNREYEELLHENEELKQLIEESKDAKIIVHRKVYPGVLIHILNKTYEVTEERNSGVFCLKGDTIVFEPA